MIFSPLKVAYKIDININPKKAPDFDNISPCILKKILLKNRYLKPDPGFSKKRPTIDQLYLITNVISKTLKENKYCCGVFRDVSQAFDKVCAKKTIYENTKTTVSHLMRTFKNLPNSTTVLSYI